MPIIEPIAAFTDNYIWLLHDADGVHVVDPGDAAPVLETLESRGLKLASIILTHHHFDHVGGVKALKAATCCTVYGPCNPAIEDIDIHVQDGDAVKIGSYHFDILAVPGHTLDHIAYFQDGTQDCSSPLLFCGDTLFAGGCGRIFEGNPPMMYQSLQRLAALPADTQAYCAHEYTLANLAFARAADPENELLRDRISDAKALRKRGRPTVPSTIGLERATNPFLRSATQGTQSALVAAGRDAGSNPVEAFAALRAWKDNF